ncbi:MAG TPA: FAD-binding oxidoreductase [Myxococcales bacterium]|jgi:FAD/FMN-containing dehydrogenase
MRMPVEVARTGVDAIAEARHEAKVARIVQQLRAHDGTRPVSLRKKAVAHQVPKAHDLRHRDEKIDIRDLDEILLIDPVRRICIAESGVTFVELVQATMQHGLVPLVVPELKTITVGGAVAGCSIESMSFVHGGFHDTCLEYEVLTATGDVLRCTPDNENRLVFQMVHGTFGTLGIVSKLTFRLVPAKPYVHLVYERYPTLESYQAAIAHHAQARDVDFMDGIIHSPSLYVLSVGRFVDRAPYTSRYDWMKIYYLSTAERTEDYLETPQYFFRYDRGVTNVRPRSFVGRLLFGKALSSNEWLRLAEKLHWVLPAFRPTVTLDVFVPFSKVPEFLDWYRDEIGHFPLWCVPYRRVHDYEWLDAAYWARNQDTLFLDLAIYGLRHRDPRGVHRKVEQKLRELGGVKTLIDHNYYSEEEFWSVWSRANYQRAKAITDPNNLFRDLYTKTCRAAMGRAT